MNEKLLAKLAKAIEQLVMIQRDLQQEISNQVPVFPESRKHLIDEGICLNCGEKILPNEKEVRKVHERCRQEQRRGSHSDNELVRLGLLAPEDTTGRKRIRRTEEAIKRASLAAEDGKTRRKKHN